MVVFTIIQYTFPSDGTTLPHFYLKTNFYKYFSMSMADLSNSTATNTSDLTTRNVYYALKAIVDTLVQT